MVDYTDIRRELARREMARRSYRHFVKAFYPDFKETPFHLTLITILEDFIMRCERGQSPRVIIEAPPRHGKSLLCTRALAPYALSRNPTKSFVGASATQTLANYFGVEMRRICNDPIYTELFPSAKPSKASNAVDQMFTMSGGGYYLAGVGSQLTGIGADFLVIDDPIADENMLASETEMTKLWDWYNSVALTRMQNGGGIIVMHTRWGVNDLVGRILDADKDHLWERHTFEAISENHTHPFQNIGEALAPSLIPIERLLRTKADLINNGKVKTWASLYQQAPYVDAGDFFQREWFNKVHPDQMPPQESLTWYFGLDVAASTNNRADYTVIAPVGVSTSGKFYISPLLVRKRMTSLETANELLRMVKLFHPIFIASERGPLDAALGPIIRDVFSKAATPFRVKHLTRSQSKHIVASAYQGALQSGRVYIPDNAFFNESFLPEHMQFNPDGGGRHDDMVDALANAFHLLPAMRSPRPEAPHVPRTNAQLEDEQWAAIMRGRPQAASSTPFTRPNGMPYKAKT